MTAEERERMRRYIARLDRQRATLRDEVEEDVADARQLTARQRGEWIVRLRADARAILLARPDRGKVLDLEEPPAPDFRTKWKALMERYRPRQTS